MSSYRYYLEGILCYIIVFLFTHVLTICCASFVIEFYRQSEDYPIILFQTLGTFFVISSIALIFQQYITKTFIQNTRLFDNKITTFYYFQEEFAFLFIFVFYPIPCLLIISGMSSYWILSMIFVVWEIILIIIAIFIQYVFV
jgi:hypothetical protein